MSSKRRRVYSISTANNEDTNRSINAYVIDGGVVAFVTFPRNFDTNLFRDLIVAALPDGLRPIASFLEEAQSILRCHSVDDHTKNVAVYCIDHAVHLANKFDLNLDYHCEKILKEFIELRYHDFFSVYISMFTSTLEIQTSVNF